MIWKYETEFLEPYGYNYQTSFIKSIKRPDNFKTDREYLEHVTWYAAKFYTEQLKTRFNPYYISTDIKFREKEANIIVEVRYKENDKTRIFGHEYTYALYKSDYKIRNTTQLTNN